MPSRTADRLATLAVAMGLLTIHGTAHGQEYCVVCQKPDRTYRCVIERAVPTGIPLQTLCVGAMSHMGGHAHCAVRGGTVFDCDAPIQRIDPSAAAALLATPDVQRPAAGTTTGAPPPRAPTAADRPSSPAEAKTVEDLARSVTRSTGEAISGARATVEDTSRKAWDCISSLFTSCAPGGREAPKQP